ncbi:hypothetical protein HF086_016086 [Spodoptera exigua]|uniref:Uncharacterized protein n=1 Tax=Spodoptera exigua TaxID=7107 RepID=A0A922M539_SPOEX|nr:hypothetical protein HF086_016086 [Spodoptera exigua]
MPIVCCTAPEITQNNSEVSDNSSLSSELKPGTKAKEQCLKYLKTLHYTCPMARDPFDFLRSRDDTENDEAIIPSADLDSPVTDPSTESDEKIGHDEGTSKVRSLWYPQEVRSSQVLADTQREEGDTSP